MSRRRPIFNPLEGVAAPSPETPTPTTCPTCKGSVLAWPDGDRVGFHSLDCGSTNAAASPPSAPREADAAALLRTLAAEAEFPFEHKGETVVGITPELAKALASRLSASEARVKELEEDLRDVCREREEWRRLMQQWKDKAVAMKKELNAAQRRTLEVSSEAAKAPSTAPLLLRIAQLEARAAAAERHVTILRQQRNEDSPGPGRWAWEAVDALIESHARFASLRERVEQACDSGMRLNLPSREIVARVRSLLAPSEDTSDGN